MTREIKDGIQDLISSSPVNPVVVDFVGRINQKIDYLKKQTGIYPGIKKITYQQMIFIDRYLRSGDQEKAAFEANPLLKKKSSARKWGMRQLENSIIQSTIREALKGEQRLAPDRIATKVADAFDDAASVSDIIKVAEFVAKTRGEINDKPTVNVGIGVIGDKSTEELEKQFAILVGTGNELPEGPGEDSLLDEITLGDGSETGETEL